MTSTISCTCLSLQADFTNQHIKTPLKGWRCELTALSHVYNHYYICYSDAIFVYEPTFPHQGLEAGPSLVIRPPISSPKLGYGIDRETPHSINRILVDLLGQEEVLVISCDDGDVLLYHVSTIQRAIEGRPPHDEYGLPFANVTPLWHENVGMSAWGLALHRNARLLAISANTHVITVVAFALIKGSDNGEHDDFHRPSRGREQKVYHLHALHNTPSVAFDNNGTDPSGRWLFSNSIDGISYLWDLHALPFPQVARLFQLGRCLYAQDFSADFQLSCKCDIAQHAGWGTMILDQGGFEECSTMEEALGQFPTNSGDSLLRVRNVSRDFSPAPSPNESSEDEIMSIGTTDSEDNGVATTASDDHGESDANDTTNDEEAMTDEEDASDEPDEYANLLVGGNGRRIFQYSRVERPYCHIETRADLERDHNVSMPPTLFIMKNDLFLLQQPLEYFQRRSESTDPSLQLLGTKNVILHELPLYPPNSSTNLNKLRNDRQHFSLQIPSLGIFIVGSPDSGRVAICTPTTFPASDLPNPPKPTDSRRRIFGFRRDRILPTRKDEPDIAGLKLMGVAAGPVQGSLDRERPRGRDAVESAVYTRKWRLMLLYSLPQHVVDPDGYLTTTYVQHTVLSYELGRTRREEMGVADLVV